MKNQTPKATKTPKATPKAVAPKKAAATKAKREYDEAEKKAFKAGCASMYRKIKGAKDTYDRNDEV